MSSLFFVFTSCNEKENDKMIFDLLLLENSFSKKDSLTFNFEASSKRTVDFFRLRNSKDMVFKQAYKKGVVPIIGDTTYYENDSIITFERTIKGNKYLKTGKGVNKNIEEFLKDTFNYSKISYKKWNLDRVYKNMFLEESSGKNSILEISKPVYNLDNNKAIVFIKLNKKNWIKNTIYFLKKKKYWEIVYFESEQY